ncbi:hypothetical protein BV898_00766 [Hypsibius exemplaris]|uniref:Uncharacterized protein n=1 Tax=Hypsibius exemplaris TaxID=2072580 RepID=A0A1W0XER1_HYPEX|nr:hypothetical protein BV898_00766 [Hypsibius exemplaris]
MAPGDTAGQQGWFRNREDECTNVPDLPGLGSRVQRSQCYHRSYGRPGRLRGSSYTRVVQPHRSGRAGGSQDWDTPIAEKGVLRVWRLAKCLAIPSLGSFLNDNSLRFSVALRLGGLVCQCGVGVNPDGQYGLSCQKSAGRLGRHSTINDIAKRVLVTAGIQSTLEPTDLDRADGKRPEGLTLAPWKRGKALAWDVTCVDTVTDFLHPGVLDYSSPRRDKGR